MLPNPKYKTSLCKYWESSKLNRHDMPTRPEVPLCPRSARNAENGRCKLISRLSTTSFFPRNPSSRIPPTRPTPIIERSNASTLISVGSKGSCKNGDKCSFAHGEPELRASPQSQGQFQGMQSQGQFQNPQWQGQFNNSSPYLPQMPQENMQNQSAPGLSDNQIIYFQLSFIIQKLVEVYPTNEQVQYFLRMAIEQLNQGNIDASADTLHVT